MNRHSTFRIRRAAPTSQRGISMLEILGALAVGAVLVMSLASVMDASLEDTKGQQAAYYQSQVAAAGQKYIAANNAALRTSLPSASSLVAVGVPQLIAGKHLSGSTGTRNVYGQTPCVLIRQPDPAGKPGQFDALVVTSNGEPIPDRVLAMVAANAGPGGGYIAAGDTGNAKGASWRTSTAAYRSAACAGGKALNGGDDDGGNLASNLFHDGPGQQDAEFLYRGAVPGRPELNRMRTPIRMEGDALVAIGASCLDADGASRAAIAIDAATRSLAMCGGAGKWAPISQWKDPVAAHASLPAVNNTRGDVRMVTGLSRAFTWDGGSWVALAVDKDGNMAVPGQLTAANIHAHQNIDAGGTIKAAGDISTSSTVTAYDMVATHRIETVDLEASNRIDTRDLVAKHNVVTEGLQVNRWISSPAISIGINYFTPGAACHYLEYDPWEGTTHITFPMGTVVMDANYVPLICGPDKTMRYANGTYTP